MKRKFSMALLLVMMGACASLYAQNWSGIIAPSRATDWSGSGVVGGIPSRTVICATLNPGATVAQINSAIAACPANEVVYLNPGTYSGLSGQIFFNNKSNVTLRGAGPDQTFLVFSSGGDCNGLGANICVMNADSNYSGDPHNTATWTAGYNQGTTSITLSGASNLHVGSLLILDQLDDTSDTGNIYLCQTTSGCSWQGGIGNGRSGRAQNQTVTVTSINGSAPATVGISPGLRAGRRKKCHR
jgi:pectin methylesterase-like acyl-CoA thioesterase